MDKEDLTKKDCMRHGETLDNRDQCHWKDNIHIERMVELGVKKGDSRSSVL